MQQSPPLSSPPALFRNTSNTHVEPFEIRKIAVCSLWILLPGDYRVTDEALLAETT